MKDPDMDGWKVKASKSKRLRPMRRPARTHSYMYRYEPPVISSTNGESPEWHRIRAVMYKFTNGEMGAPQPHGNRHHMGI